MPDTESPEMLNESIEIANPKNQDDDCQPIQGWPCTGINLFTSQSTPPAAALSKLIMASDLS
jgi:hypothetical protein